MKIHHLNCSSLYPLGGRLMDGITPGFGSARMVCHCLLIETDQGLVLVDTGLGTRDVRDPERRISNLFRRTLRPALRESETAISQIQHLGFPPYDVRHIILSHLDFDNVGGVDDFPHATVHLMHEEKKAAINSASILARSRYSHEQLKQIRTWKTYQPRGESWFGLPAVNELEGLPPEILLIPLKGHTLGHAGVAVQSDQGWLLYAGDAYFHRGELAQRPSCPPALQAYETMMEADRKSRLLSLKRLRQLAHNHSDELEIFSAHDALEFLRMQKSRKQGLKPWQESGVRRPEEREIIYFNP